MPRTETVASRGTEHDAVVLAVGAVVLVGVLLMGAWVAHGQAVASTTKPQVTVVTSDGTGPDGSPSAATTTPTTPAPAQAPASNHVIPGQTTSLSVGGASGAGESLSQTISVSVQPGPLTVTPSSDSVTFSRSGNGGDSYLGALPLVKVVDARGSLVGWDTSVSLQGIDGLSSSELAGARLCANPDPPTIVAGNPGEVRGAKNSCGGVGEPVSVFFAPSGGGGGTFTDTASLTLSIPAGNAGPVTASLAVTVH